MINVFPDRYAVVQDQGASPDEDITKELPTQNRTSPPALPSQEDQGATQSPDGGAGYAPPSPHYSLFHESGDGDDAPFGGSLPYWGPAMPRDHNRPVPLGDHEMHHP